MDTTLAPLQHFRQRSPGQPSTAKNAHACVTAALSMTGGITKLNKNPKFQNDLAILANII